MQINSLNQITEYESPNIKEAKSAKDVDAEPQRNLPSDLPPDKQAEKLSELKNTLAEHNISLSFSRDDSTNELVIKLVDSKTGEAIRQTPSEVTLKLAAIYSKVQGQFFDERV